MHSSLQNIRPAQMQNLQQEKTYVNKQNQVQNEHRQVQMTAVKENEQNVQKLEETSKTDDKEIGDYLKKKKEQENRKKKKRRRKKGLYTLKNDDGNEELHVDIKV